MSSIRSYFMGYLVLRLNYQVCFYYLGACIWLFMIQLFKADLTHLLMQTLVYL